MHVKSVFAEVCIGNHGDTHLFAKDLGSDLIHTNGRGICVTANVRNTRKGEKSLHGAILTVFAVKHGKYRVYVNNGAVLKKDALMCL